MQHKNFTTEILVWGLVFGIKLPYQPKKTKKLKVLSAEANQYLYRNRIRVKISRRLEEQSVTVNSFRVALLFKALIFERSFYIINSIRRGS